MAKKFLFLIFQLGFLPLYAQFGPQQIIAVDYNGVYCSLAYDMDGDDWLDVVAISFNGRMSWYRNEDGLGSFGSEILIYEQSGFSFREFVDIDSDGDDDILYSISSQSKIAWFENLDGVGNFGPEQIIFTTSMGVKAVDLDNDGDQDLLGSYNGDPFDSLVWFENTDGMGNFGNETPIMQNQIALNMPLSVDVDNDGDLDLISSHENNGPAQIFWLENLGDGSLGPVKEIYQFTFFSDTTSIFYMTYADINTDGIRDLIVTTYHDDYGISYLWFESDGSGSYGPPQGFNNFGLGAYDFYDLDNDGDNDILSFYPFLVDEVFWVENTDGQGDFSIRRVISDEMDNPRMARAGDFNGDGLLDVTSASSGENKVAWYENTGILGITEKDEATFKIFPNPVQNMLNLSSSLEIERVEVFNTLGKRIMVFGNVSQIWVEGLPSGIYIIKSTDVNGGSSLHKVIKM